MTPEQAKALREPFPAETVGQLPRVWCRACTQANKERFGTTCDAHHKVKCAVCHSTISEAHLHLDYVGHAAATDRLLQVDPDWTWEPLALTDEGLPLVKYDQLWIRLTVAGVTRLGVGDGASDKERIGDAIRNAAMRFGVALDLWSKEDLRQQGDGDNSEKGTPASQQAIARIAAALKEVHGTEERARLTEEIRQRWGGASELRAADVDAVLEHIASVLEAPFVPTNEDGTPAPTLLEEKPTGKKVDTGRAAEETAAL